MQPGYSIFDTGINRIPMSLFADSYDTTQNLLPYDGIVHYHPSFLTPAEANQFFTQLFTGIEWQHDTAVMLGKLIVTKRKVAWYGEKPFSYTYSNTTKTALPWTTELLALKKIAETQSGELFNSCLLNLYHDGNEGMAWHSDAEKQLAPDGAIASVSLGAERIFKFRHKQTKETVSILLEHGSMLVMKGSTQRHWLHRLPPSVKIMKPRVNLTFRTIVS